MSDGPVLSVWGGAIVGARSDQQDTFLMEPLPAANGLLAIVADGMGGHASGGLASRTAAYAFRDRFLDLQARATSLDDALGKALQAANEAIQTMQAGHPERQGMGTTLVAIYRSPLGLSWISVGDSALLLCRQNQVHRLNEDHSLRALPEFADSKQGNMLRSALTGDEITLIDCHAEPIVLEDDDTVLLASDGLLTLSSFEIVDAVRSPDAARADVLGPDLLRAVERKGDPKQDNCTIVVIAAPIERDHRSSKRSSDTISPTAPQMAAQSAAPAQGATPSHVRLVGVLLIVGVVLIGAALLALYL